MSRRRGLSPTQRTLAALRQRGCLAEVVERWNQYAGPYGVRQDLFGFIDVLALVPGITGCLGVQACSGSGCAARVRKIKEECWEAAEQWLQAGNRIEVWAWRKVKLKRGGKAVRWSPRVVQVTDRIDEYSTNAPVHVDDSGFPVKEEEQHEMGR